MSADNIHGFLTGVCRSGAAIKIGLNYRSLTEFLVMLSPSFASLIDKLKIIKSPSTTGEKYCMYKRLKLLAQILQRNLEVHFAAV